MQVVLLEGRGSTHDPNTDSAHRVRGKQQRERLDEVNDLDLVLVSELIKHDDSLVVPDLDPAVLTAGGDQA